MTETEDTPKVETPVSPEEKRRRKASDWSARAVHHTGSQKRHKFSVIQSPETVLSEGVADMAGFLGCFWLMDIIASAQLTMRSLPTDKTDFQVWYVVAPDASHLVVACGDGNMDESDARNILLSKQEHPWMFKQDVGTHSFPLDFYKLYCEFDGAVYTVMLPSER